MTVDQRKNQQKQRPQFHVKEEMKMLEIEMLMDGLVNRVNHEFAENL